jgi:hypothetical protein
MERRTEQIAAIRKLLEERAQMKARIAFLHRRLQEGFEESSILTPAEVAMPGSMPSFSNTAMRNWYEDVVASETVYDEELLDKNRKELETLLENRKKLQRLIENEQGYITNRLQRKLFQLFEIERVNRMKGWSLMDELGTSLFMLRPDKAHEDEFRSALREVKGLNEQRFQTQVEWLGMCQHVNRLNAACFNLTTNFHDRALDQRALSGRRMRAATRETG